MKTVELLSNALSNKKFRISVKGIHNWDDSIYYFAENEEDRKLTIYTHPDNLINFGFLKGFINDAINTVRTEFNAGFKENYDSDVHLRKNLEERIKKHPYMIFYPKDIKDVQLRHREGDIKEIEILLEPGTIVRIFSIECTNLDESNKALNKHNIS